MKTLTVLCALDVMLEVTSLNNLTAATNLCWKVDVALPVSPPWKSNRKRKA